MEDTSWWIWGSCPTGHKSQELRKAFGGDRGGGGSSLSLVVRAFPGGRGQDSRLKVRLGRKGGQVSKSVTQQPSLSLDRGGHRWRRGNKKEEPVLNN